MTLPAAVAAEVRFLESGRNTRLDTAAHCFTVRSESGERTKVVLNRFLEQTGEETA